MALVTKKEISIAYNEAILDLILDGYILSPFTNVGSVHHSYHYTDLVSKDNKSIIRVWLTKGYESFNSDHSDSCVKTISIKTMVYRFRGRLSEKYLSIDSSDFDVLNVISEQKFYVVNSRGSDIYCVDSYDEMASILMKRYIRGNIKRSIPDYGIDRREIDLKKVPGEVIDFIMDKINRCKGCKRATASCLKRGSFCKSDAYRRDTRFTDLRLYATFDWEFNGKHGTVSMK